MKYKKYINGLEIEHSIFILTSIGEKWFKVILPEGIHGYVFYVQGNDVLNAIDYVANFLKDNNFSGLFKTYDQIWESAKEIGIDVDSYEEQYIIAGNSGIYLKESITCEEIL